MRKTGKVVDWKDDKGFGFIEPSAGGKQLFVHIKAFPRAAQRPTNGTEVSYIEASDAQGRARAEEVQLLAAQLSFGPELKALIVAALFLLAVAAIVMYGILPNQVLWGYLGMSGLTFVFYAFDKVSAKMGDQRTPENTLHLLALLGGWPGALYAQQALRHKTRKQSFRSVFWAMLALNLAGFGYLVSGYGTWLVKLFGAMVG
jgi:uncharacterized membrane protein YsdA (DUF1294 family)/cold shock CspA family protein